MKTAILALLILPLAIGLTAPPATAEQADAKRQAGQPSTVGKSAGVILRGNVKVTSKIVTLGDLFENAGEKAAIAVAYAPSPGKRAVFDARWLYRIAKAHRLRWRPLDRHAQAVVERESIVITREEIESEIAVALAEKGIDGTLEVELSNRMMQMHVPAGEIAAVGVNDITYDPRSRRFAAILVAPVGSPSAQRTRITGMVHRTREIPVLARRVLGDDIIRKTDITWLNVRTKRLRADIITDEADLIGKSPKRGLRPGYPVRSSAVRRPILVPKGGLVTMVLQVPQMLLTAQGKALENGSDGDVIRITNLRSKTVVEAEVIGGGKVAVRANSLLALN